VEVAEPKSSVASSDEAAGISTIGLKPKRLSGAQRKRLNRERNSRGNLDGTESFEKNSISG
jgi:hypothetical protein